MVRVAEQFGVLKSALPGTNINISTACLLELGVIYGTHRVVRDVHWERVKFVLQGASVGCPQLAIFSFPLSRWCLGL